MCTCEEPASVLDDIGLDDESASIVIVGGGPHALAALAALHDSSQCGDADSLQKVGTVCIVDPGSHFMESWNHRFEALEITNLRSPSFAHPVTFEPTALLDYAVREGRTSELVDAPVTRWLPTTDLSEQAPLLKAMPSSALFRDFCASLEAKLPHRWLSGKATSVCKDSSTGEFRLHYATADGRERKVVARAVVLATGPVGKWTVPASFEPHVASRLILHTEELLLEGNGTTLRDEITRKCPQGGSARVLVIGGGISAAQAALAAYRAGHRVVLRSRRPLQTRAFDIEAEWLDVRHADRLRYEFLSLPIQRRREAVRQATSGGSVPANYMEELRRIAEESPDALRLEVDEHIERSDVRVLVSGGGGGDGGGEHVVVVNGEAFAMVVLATGVATAPSSSPLYRSVEELLAAPTVEGLPHVDSTLRWSGGSGGSGGGGGGGGGGSGGGGGGGGFGGDDDVFVLGANAMLELGPGAANLLGAMRGARIVSNELHGLMWRHADGRRAGRPERATFSNKYAMLLDGSQAEIDVLVQRLHLSTKAESALRKACKHRKAPKGSAPPAAPAVYGLAANNRRVPGYGTQQMKSLAQKRSPAVFGV